MDFISHYWNEDYQENSESVFSTNRNGLETFIVILPVIFYAFITLIIESYFQFRENVRLFLELFTLIVPLILGMTILADQAATILYILFMICILFLSKFLKNAVFVGNTFDTQFLTSSRSGINIISVIAILAVDFSTFPYRFEKTHTMGYSLMDTGVGLFVYANGIVSPESRQVRNPILKSFKGSLILFFIGTGRFFLTQIFDYHVAASEYGVHWNFFITLGVTKVLTSFVLNIFNVRFIWINATMLLLAHEMLLQSGLQEFVFSEDERDNLIKANKEGLVSSLGFITLYLFSVYFGYVMDFKRKSQYVKSVLKKHLIGVFLSLFFAICFQQLFGISRRLANAAYICWILFLGTFFQTVFYLLDLVQKAIFKKPVLVPYICEAVGYNGLPFFCVANWLTGIINVVTDTKQYGPLSAFLIVLGYMCANLFVVSYLYAKKIKFKL